MARFLKSREKVKGKMPGALIFQGEQRQPEVRLSCIRYNETHIEQFETDISGLDGLVIPDMVTWISVEGLHDTETIRKIGEKFDVASLALEDILNTDQRPRFFEDDDQLVIIMKSMAFDEKTKELHSDQVSLLLGANYLVSFQERTSNLWDDILYRLQKSKGRIRRVGSDYLAYALMDTLVDSYIINIESFGHTVESLEKELIEPEKHHAETIFRNKTEITFFRKNIRPVKEVVTRFEKTEVDFVSEKVRLYYLPDLADLATQAIDAIEIYYTMVADQLNIYNTNMNNKANDVMKVLTIFAAIFIPLTFIAGVYGTNFEYVPELTYKYSYFLMWGVMIIVAGAMLAYFRRKHWF
ncbi:MAG: magnesium/cobalt transporter CorA [Salinivirgaceae bacterium]|jgi:magnesium transporter|nr:magnesium/cobalt transporter CorA [Salinivirgaceae bacterium]